MLPPAPAKAVHDPAKAVHGPIGVRRSVEVIASCTGRGCARRLLTKAGGSYTFASGVKDGSFRLFPTQIVYHVACPSCGHRNEIPILFPLFFPHLPINSEIPE